ncbi:cyclin-L2-like [Tropilaelaps mercedesae]|uniref:Cyclin-L2-like n=1 Tax=Tropilaelaps mercedesae TaxID=418985 RepID=A0A1V9X449_9ACAR|nr:cyclin-L2-like [Tropilaelaps mercedesae]
MAVAVTVASGNAGGRASESSRPPMTASRQRIRNVVLNLENCILSHERLLNTPSLQDGLDAELEIDLRFVGCEMIQSAGILLRLPQVAMATGQVLYQRFYYSKSFVAHNFEIVAMACVVLASKIEEAPRRVRDVLNAFHHLEQLRRKQTPEPLLLDHTYMTLKNQVIKAERRVLKELGFCVHVKHPHKMIVTLLEVVLRQESNERLLQLACGMTFILFSAEDERRGRVDLTSEARGWERNYMNDSLRSDIFVRHTPETIACACIHLAARLIRTPLPNSPQWYRPFGVTDSDIEDASIRILSLYARPKVDVDHLGEVIKELRAKQQEEKKASTSYATRLKLIVGTKVIVRGRGDSEAVENSNSNSNVQGPSLKAQWLQGRAGEIVPVSNGTKRDYHISVGRDDHKDETRNHNKVELNLQRTQRDAASRGGFPESHEREREKRRSDERHTAIDKDNNNDDDRRSGSAKKSHKRRSRERSRSRTISPDRRRRNRGRVARSRSRSRDNGRRRDRR